MQLDLSSFLPVIARHFGAHPCTKGKVTTDKSCVDGSRCRTWVYCGRRQNYKAWILTYSRFELGSDQRYLSDKIMTLYSFAKNEIFWKDGNGHELIFPYTQGKQAKNYLLSPLIQNPNDMYTFTIHLRPTFCIHILQQIQISANDNCGIDIA